MKKILLFFFLLSFCFLYSFSNLYAEEYDFGDGSSAVLYEKASLAFLKNKYKNTIVYAEKCISEYSEKAIEQQRPLSDFAPEDEAASYWALNDVAACFLLKGKALQKMNRKSEAKRIFQDVIDLFPYAQSWDEGGKFFWKVTTAAKDQIISIKQNIDFGDYKSENLTKSAWKAFKSNKNKKAFIYIDKCIEIYDKTAKEQQASLNSFAKKKTAFNYWALNDVTTCKFIKGKILLKQKKKEKAKKLFEDILNNYQFAQCWNPKGYFWKVADAAGDELLMIKYNIDFGHYKSNELTGKAWQAFEAKNYKVLDIYTNKCIKMYQKHAKAQQKRLKSLPTGDDVHKNWALNDVATCYFIKAKGFQKQKKNDKAKKIYNKIIKLFPYAQCFDTSGWFWRVSEAAKDQIIMMETGIDFGDSTSAYLTGKAWEALNERKHDIAFIFAKKCISSYSKEADKQQSYLSSFPRKKAAKEYWALNDVGTCYFIMGKAYQEKMMWKKSADSFKKVLDKYSFAQAWDKKGFYWKIAVAARSEYKKVSSKK